ncbi:hypothetical protein C8J56DRAFT_1040465 [Mycena floridula]|nr:hypothetical protein C8J56DRAFT_1040465 [Mycena floridula]
MASAGPTKDQLYHQRHREEQLAASHKYYMNIVKPQREQLRLQSEPEEDSQCTIYTSADVAEELTDLESEVSEWKENWGVLDWKKLTGILSDEEL